MTALREEDLKARVPYLRLGVTDDQALGEILALLTDVIRSGDFVLGRALKECKGVEDVSVDLKGGTATVVGTGLDEAEIREKVEKAGYEVTAMDT